MSHQIHKSLTAVLIACGLAAGCATSKLASSGPYGNNQALYTADLAITASYDILQKFVLWEFENRAALAQWPEVKQAADAIRRDAPGLINSAIALREVYAAFPNENNRASLITILTLLQQATMEATKYQAKHSTSL